MRRPDAAAGRGGRRAVRTLVDFLDGVLAILSEERALARKEGGEGEEAR